MIEREEVISENQEDLEFINSLRTLEFDIDENYNYVPTNIGFKLTSDILYYFFYHTYKNAKKHSDSSAKP